MRQASSTTKWLCKNSAPWVLSFTLSPPTTPHTYSITSANDYPGRDPTSWVLSCAHGANAYEALDTITGYNVTGVGSFTSYGTFTIAPPTAAPTAQYTNCELLITANAGGGRNDGDPDMCQIGDLQFFDANDVPIPLIAADVTDNRTCSSPPNEGVRSPISIPVPALCLPCACPVLALCLHLWGHERCPLTHRVGASSRSSAAARRRLGRK